MNSKGQALIEAVLVCLFLTFSLWEIYTLSFKIIYNGLKDEVYEEYNLCQSTGSLKCIQQFQKKINHLKKGLSF